MDKALKQRLVGAIVLIILAVIVLPMLLSGRSDTLKQESRQIELPPKPEELSFETRRFPIEVPNEAGNATRDTTQEQAHESQDADPQDVIGGTLAGGDQTTTEHAPGVAVTQPEMTVIETPDLAPDSGDDPVLVSDGNDLTVNQDSPADDDQPVLLPQPGPESGDQPGAATNQLTQTPRYLVQVASFSSEKNANALMERLQSDNMPVVMDVIDRFAGPMHRVRVGPFEERSDADAIVAHLQLQMKQLNPRVLDLRPGDSAPVSTPSDPLVRWVVQVGSFSSPANAESLVAQLRLAGLTAFIEQVTAADGTVFKVRIGPEIDRDKATDLARKVKAEHGLDGLVMTMD